VSLPLLPKLALTGGCLALAIDGGRLLQSALANGIDSVFNDFYDYWGAAVLLNRGGSPYDINALNSVLHTAGLHTEVGGGYSYPLLLAQVLRPLALLTPHTAAVVFSALSLLALGLSASLLLGGLSPLRLPHAVVGGIAFAVFPPVDGSLYFGQANLLVLVPLTLAWRLVSPGPWLAVATAIKLYPATGFLSYLTRPSRESRTQLISGGAVMAALLLIPQLGAHGSFLGQTGALLAPDTYWSNASVNGWISRLSQPSNLTSPPLPGLPVGPTVIVLCAVLALATLVVLVRARDAPLSARLALCLCLGAVVAPKNSFWNFAPLILAVASVWQLWARRWWPLVATAVGFGLIQAQSVIDTARGTFYRGGSYMTWLSALALYGALLIGGALAGLLLAQPGTLVPDAGAEPPASEAQRSAGGNRHEGVDSAGI
jgi:hypothetical protein